MKAPIDNHLIHFNFPPLKSAQLENGLTLVVIENHLLPKIYFRLGFVYGLKDDPQNMAGLSELMVATLKKGTTKFSYEEIIERIESVGGVLDSTCNEDFYFIYGEVLSDYLQNTVEMLAQVGCCPAFPEIEVRKEQMKMLADLHNENSSPGFIATRRLDRAIYSPHPYGLHKSEESIQRITREDLVREHARFFLPQNAHLLFAGDISFDEAKKLAEQYFGEWGGGFKSVHYPDVPVNSREAIVQIVDRPGSEQANILLGKVLFERKHPDFIPMMILNRILGGGSSGRLFLYLREEKGYTYGAYSTLNCLRDSGSWIANAEVRNDVVAAALQGMFDKINEIRDKGVSEEELNVTKRYLIGNFPLQNESPASIAALAMRQRLHKLAPDYWNQYLEAVDKVQLSDLAEMAEKYLSPDSMQIVVVGDAEKLREQLQQFGSIQIYNVKDEIQQNVQ